jgi:hypothetical protein
MRRLIPLGVTIALAVFIATASAIAQQWVAYQPPGNEFRVEFPGKATERTEQLHSGGLYVVAEFAGDGSYYFATVNQISGSQMAVPVPELLDLIRDAEVEKTKGKVRSEEPSMLEDAPARRLTIDAPGPIVLDVLLIVKGDRLYQAVCSAGRAHESRADVKRFFDSFAVLLQ